jgi:nucleotide-binding universal stress UspA family protein
MLKMKTILYPTDFSVNAEAALELASVLAEEGRGRLVVLHVERQPLATLGGISGVPPLVVEFDDREVREKLNQIQPTRSGFIVEHRLGYGDPATTILKTAEEIGADLIVMGTHGRTGLARLLMGSVAEHVVRKAQCPVLTVRTSSQTLLTLPNNGSGFPAGKQEVETPLTVSHRIALEASLVTPEMEAVS